MNKTREVAEGHLHPPTSRKGTFPPISPRLPPTRGTKERTFSYSSTLTCVMASSPSIDLNALPGKNDTRLLFTVPASAES